ncbi:MAG: tetratricopeptide repeat protein [Candidatus Caenarcaniphilales bacterium]|nr:tetratricopeptide repeat protein [Candidatus Caenarcaniphilales bacterium]
MSINQKDFQQAVEYHKSGDLDNAEKFYSELLTQAPDNADLNHLMGVVDYQKKHFDSAIKRIYRAIELNGTKPSYFVNLGAALQNLGKTVEAEQTYYKALELSPGFFDAERNLALLLFQKNDYQSAVSKYQKLIQQQPNFPEIHFELGNVFCLSGDYENAVKQYSKAIKLKPEFAQAYNYLGVALKGLDKVDEAIQACEKSIELNPSNHEVFNNIGNLFQYKEEFQKAIDSYRKALSLAPNYPEAYYNLANATFKLNKNFQEAIDFYQKAIELKPTYLDALNNLANLYKEQGDFELSAATYEKVISINSNHAEAHNNLGNLLQDTRDFANAIKHYQKAIQIKPNYPAALSNLGNALCEIGYFKDAIICQQKAISLKADYAEAHSNLGNAFQAVGLIDDAEKSYKRAIEIRPNLAETLNNLGTVYKDKGRLTDAIECYKKALEIKENYPYAFSNLGVSLKSKGLVKEAIQVYRKAIEINPSLVAAHSNLLLTLNYVDYLSPQEIYEEHLNWATIHSNKQKRFSQYKQSLEPNRKIKIAYVSPDFKNHSVAYFIEPILSNHQKERFEVTCYSGVTNPDDTTFRLKSYVDNWVNIFGFDDEKLAQKIYEDQIDILVDLSGHTSDNRVLAFSFKPAPVQLTYIGYPNTTGMESMDYRLVDSISDPKGESDQLHSEELIRILGSFLCYSPPENIPDIGILPAKQNGYITFASFNNLAKITNKVIELWSKILKHLPSSKLIIKNHSLTDEDTANYYSSVFESYGIEANRIEFHGWIKSKTEHLGLYNQVDIALDTFPYNGTTTTCEALLMGVPVVTFPGDVHASRVGASLLTSAGLNEFIAENEDGYINKVLALSKDIDQLASCRETLRKTILQSSLCNGSEFTKKLENIYQNIWSSYCQKEGKK